MSVSHHLGARDHTQVPLQEEQVFLITESSFWPLFLNYLKIFIWQTGRVEKAVDSSILEAEASTSLYSRSVWSTYGWSRRASSYQQTC